MDPALEAVVEKVRSALAAPSLRRTDDPRLDPKWKMGYALASIPAPSWEAVALSAGLDLDLAKTYRKAAVAWPPETRKRASWSVHRDLANSTKLYDANERFAVIRDDMTLREAVVLRTGRELDRKGTHRLSDDDLIAELANVLLHPRPGFIDKLYEKVNDSKEGRRTARAKRASAALRRLDREIRDIQLEIKRHRDRSSARVRALEVGRGLLNLEAHVEEAALLWEHSRWEVDDEDWTDLGRKLDDIGRRAAQVAARILMTTDVDDTEGWDAGPGEIWQAPELGTGDDDIAEAEIVDETETR